MPCGVTATAGSNPALSACKLLHCNVLCRVPLSSLSAVFLYQNAPVPISVPVRVAGRQEPGRRVGGTPVPIGPCESVIRRSQAARPLFLRIGHEPTPALMLLLPAFPLGIHDRAIDDDGQPGGARQLVVVRPDRPTPARPKSAGCPFVTKRGRLSAVAKD
jgi:hypothetical protein